MISAWIEMGFNASIISKNIPTAFAGSEFLIYGDPGYGAYRGNFGGVSLNSGLYGYKSKKSAKA